MGKNGLSLGQGESIFLPDSCANVGQRMTVTVIMVNNIQKAATE
jgi:hypothetical protein